MYSKRKQLRDLVLTLLLGAAVAGVPTHAAEVEFLPTVELQAGHDGNVGVTGQEDLSDEYVRLSVDLALQARSGRTDWTLSYQPSRDVYSNQDTADFTGHRFVATMRHDASRKASVSLTSYFTRTERQGLSGDLPDQAVTLVPRTTIQRIGLDVGGRVVVGKRSFWTWGLGGETQDLDDPAAEFEDSDEFRGSVGWGRQLSKAVSMGIEYGHSVLSFEVREDTDVDTLQLFLEKRFRNGFEGGVRAGVFRADSGAESTSEPSMEATLSRDLGKGSAMVLGLRQSASSGDGVTTASRDRGGYLRWKHDTPRALQVSVGLGYWDRESLDFGQDMRSGTKALITDSNLGWKTPVHLTVGLFHRYYDQTRESGEISELPLDTNYHSGGLFLRWTPLHKQR